MNSGATPMTKEFCSISIYLYGKYLLADEVSKLLGMSPTSSRNRGHVRLTSSGSEITQKIGYWEFRVKTDKNLVAQRTSELLSGFKCRKIVGHAGIEKAELDIFVPLDHEEDSQNGFSFEMPASLLVKLSKLGFDIVVTAR